MFINWNRIKRVGAIFLLISIIACLQYSSFKNKTINTTNVKQKELPQIFNKYLTSHILENSCRFPLILPFERNIINNVALYGPLHCNSAMPNMARLTFDNKLIVFNELENVKRKKVPFFQCYYHGLSGGLKGNITSYSYANNKININPDRPVEIFHQNIVVKCVNKTNVEMFNGTLMQNDTVFFEKAFATFANFKEKRKKAATATPEKPSMAILVLDSVAQNQFLRHMPETTKLMKKMGFIFLNGYTKVGDNSAVNLMPILAGKSILPQVGGNGKEILNNKTSIKLESIEFLWDLMKQRNCITMLNDDVKNVERGLFHYPQPTFEGFAKSPTDYYFRPYHLYNIKHLIAWKEMCLRTGEANIEESLNIYERFSLLFKHSCHFSFNFLTSLTHDDSSNLNAIDEKVRTILERFIANNVTENTILVIMGDHGNRIGDIQHSFVGRIEERMPLFSIYLPAKFQKLYPESVKNLRFNSNRLTSNFDIYQTLRDIANGKVEQNPRFSTNSYTRGISLFNEKLSKERTCEEAGIPINFCICMEQRKMSRLNNESSEYQGVNESLKKFLVENMPCTFINTFKIIDDRLKAFSLNQMVRHGLRDANMFSQYANIQAALEILYFDVNAEIEVKGKKVKFIARIKHYAKEKFFDVMDVPIVSSENGSISLLSLCN